MITVGVDGFGLSTYPATRSKTKHKPATTYQGFLGGVGGIGVTGNSSGAGGVVSDVMGDGGFSAVSISVLIGYLPVGYFVSGFASLHAEKYFDLMNL